MRRLGGPARKRGRGTRRDLAHNAAPMRREGSDRAPLPAALAPLAVILGVAAMLAAAPRAAPLGLRTGLLLSELALVAPGLLLFLLLGGRLARLPGAPLPGRSAFLLSAASGGALWVASLGLFELQYTLWRPPPGYLEAFRFLHERLRPSGPLDALGSLLAIAAAPALCEELLFRGLVLPSLVRPLGPLGASAASAALFGLIHLDATAGGALSLYRVPFAFAVGLGFAALRLGSRGLAAPVLAHATLNAITFAATPFADDPAAGLPDPRPLLGAALLAAGLLSTLGLLRRLSATTTTDRLDSRA